MKLGAMAHIFNPITQEAKTGGSPQFEASLQCDIATPWLKT